MSNLLPLFRQTLRALFRAPGYWLATTLTLAQAAARQRREWGIRAALGACFAWALGRLLQHQFQAVSLLAPGLLAFAVVSLGLTGLCAGLGTALRAARVNPSEALRTE